MTQLLRLQSTFFPITRGFGSEPLSRKLRKEFQRSVAHIGVQGPFVKAAWSHVPITFTQNDYKLRDYPHNDAMVINCSIGGFVVHNVLVDNGSATDILTANTYTLMGFEEKELKLSASPPCAFRGRKIDVLGSTLLEVSFGQGNNCRTEDIIFDVVDIIYPYNAIIGRPTLNAFEVVLHSAYLTMKIPSRFEVITVYGSQEVARKVEGTWVPHNKQVNSICSAAKEAP